MTIYGIIHVERTDNHFRAFVNSAFTNKEAALTLVNELNKHVDDASHYFYFVELPVLDYTATGVQEELLPHIFTNGELTDSWDFEKFIAKNFSKTIDR